MWPYEERTNTVHREYPFSILFCGKESCPSGYTWGGVRSHYLFHYVLEGNGRLETGGATYRIYQGGGFFLYPGQSHTYRADKRNPWTYIWLGIAGTRSTDQLFELIGLTRETPSFEAPLDAILSSRMHAILRTLGRRPAGYQLKVAGYAYFVLARLAELVPGERSRALHLSGDVVRDVKGYVRLNYHSRATSVASIAHFMGYDESTIYRQFVKAEGIGVQRYLKLRRLEESERLLRDTDLPAYQVAASVGMEYVPFCRAFKAHLGCTPRDYRGRHASAPGGQGASSSPAR